MTRHQGGNFPDQTQARLLRARRAERRARISQLLLQHVSYETMAEEFGVSRRMILKDVKVILDTWAEEQLPEDRHRWRLQELQKLAEMENAIRDVVINEGEETEDGILSRPYSIGYQLKAIGRTLSIMERRARLLGLDLQVQKEESRPTFGKIIVHIHDDTAETKGKMGNRILPRGDVIDGESRDVPQEEWDSYDHTESYDASNA